MPLSTLMPSATSSATLDLTASLPWCSSRLLPNLIRLRNRRRSPHHLTRIIGEVARELLHDRIVSIPRLTAADDVSLDKPIGYCMNNFDCHSGSPFLW